MSASTVAVRFAGIAKEFMVSNTLDLGFISVRWYGIIIAFGLLLAALFGGRIAYKWKISLDKMVDVLLYGVIFGIVGARLYYVAFKWEDFSGDLWSVFEIWNGGLAIYGGIIGGLLAALVVCKLEHINVRNLLDMVGMSLLIGQGIGRWGNFANQEAFGSITYKHWGMMSDTVADYIARNPKTFGLEGVENIPQYIADNDLYVHPTFFYESVWCLVGFAILYLILRKFRTFSGELFLCYGVWYGFGRMMIEGLRTDSLFIGETSIRVSQLVSGALCLVCLVLLIVFKIHFKRHPKPIEGIDCFPEKTEKELAAEQKRAERKALRQKAKQVKIRDGKIVRPAEKTPAAPKAEKPAELQESTEEPSAAQTAENTAPSEPAQEEANDTD